MIQYAICCTCCCVTLNIGLGFALWASGVFLSKAKAWEVHTAWRQTECKVLVAGVSCVDDESRSTCGGYKAGQMPTQDVPVFLTEQIAVCPGTYWRLGPDEMHSPASPSSVDSPCLFWAPHCKSSTLHTTYHHLSKFHATRCQSRGRIPTSGMTHYVKFS